ncbi:SUMF1/EgtB/PvdO family nonheme iron enzyme [Chloroflexota bacterium]
MTLSPGQTLNNRYRVVKLLGQGGFGAVYRAWDLNMEAPCAVKENFDTSQEAVRQFKREATILHKLRHPNLPQVSDHFSVPGQGQYLVMDFVEGEDLQEMLQRVGSPLPEAQVLDWTGQVCDALEYLHSQDPPIIHRDIKPANIKITPQGKAMLVDFGIAKVYDVNLATTMGARAVTPGFSPPEQYGQGATDAQSDIYALGATCYTLLTGQAPPDSVDMITKRTPQPPAVSAVNPQVSLHTSAAIERAMQLDAEERYPTIGGFRENLAGRSEPIAVSIDSAVSAPTAQAPPTTVSPPKKASKLPWGWIGALGAVALVTAVLLFVVFGGGNGPDRAAVPTPSFAADMTTIPAGEFQMGSETGEVDEEPLHTVYLDAYAIDRYEVTNQQYAEFLNAMGNQSEGGITWIQNESRYVRIHQRGDLWAPDSGYGDHPVIEVTWFGARAFCEWRMARLPTEAEWEKAARGGLEGVTFPWGNDMPVCQKGAVNGAIFDDDAGCDDSGTEPVGSYSPNAYGLFDMAGNVWEWVADWYSSSFYSSSPNENPTGPQDGTARVLRGGSWDYDYDALRAAVRLKDSPDGSNNDFGFRCARTMSNP